MSIQIVKEKEINESSKIYTLSFGGYKQTLKNCLELKEVGLNIYDSKYYPEAKHKKVVIPYATAEMKINKRDDSLELFDYFEILTEQVWQALKKYLEDHGQNVDFEIKNPLYDTGMSFHLKIYGVNDQSNKIFSNYIARSVCLTKKKDGVYTASV